MELYGLMRLFRFYQDWHVTQGSRDARREIGVGQRRSIKHLVYRYVQHLTFPAICSDIWVALFARFRRRPQIL